MAIKNILVHVDHGKAMPARVAYALGLARQCDAHLTGLHCVTPIYLPGYVRAEIPESVLQAQTERAAKEAVADKAAFDRAVAAAGYAAKAEWRTAQGDALDALTLHGRYADLVVVGQTDPDSARDDLVDLSGSLALELGRPVLAVPYAGRFERFADHVLVAWNASREATRATNDALPLLKVAKKVTVLAVNPRGGAHGHGAQPGADIALHLARHGVKAEAAQLASDEIDPGDVLLSRAADLGADLIVMGAYGRSRLREMVLGGVTRHMMQHMTVPVLLSH